MKGKILLKNAVAMDPAAGLKNKLDLLIENGRISRLSRNITPLPDCELINAENLWLLPGLIDMHAHSRTPGAEEAEDFKSLTKAALAGGVTSVLAMPNTSPPQDNPGIIRKLEARRTRETPLNIFFAGTISKNRSGEKPADLAGLKKAGVRAFTDDGSWTEKDLLMREALRFSRKAGLPVLSHCQFPYKDKKAPINEGEISRRKNLPGIPRDSEITAVARDITLAFLSGGKLHLQHMSCLESLELIKKAREAGLALTAETCPHYFWFTEKNLENLDTNFKMNPPLRTERDRKAVIAGLKDGTLDVICSDHAPHTKKMKTLNIYDAPFGIIGLETLLSASLTKLYHAEKLSPEKIIPLLTSNPARILGLKKKGSLKPGYDADLSLVNPELVWTPDDFHSKSSNSPFLGKKLKGRNLITILKGRTVYKNGKFYL